MDRIEAAARAIRQAHTGGHAPDDDDWRAYANTARAAIKAADACGWRDMTKLTATARQEFLSCLSHYRATVSFAPRDDGGGELHENPPGALWAAVRSMLDVVPPPPDEARATSEDVSEDDIDTDEMRRRIARMAPDPEDTGTEDGDVRAFPDNQTDEQTDPLDKAVDLLNAVTGDCEPYAARRFCEVVVEAAVQRVRAELFAEDKP